MGHDFSWIWGLPSGEPGMSFFSFCSVGVSEEWVGEWRQASKSARECAGGGTRGKQVGKDVVRAEMTTSREE